MFCSARRRLAHSRGSPQKSLHGASKKAAVHTASLLRELLPLVVHLGMESVTT